MSSQVSGVGQSGFLIRNPILCDVGSDFRMVRGVWGRGELIAASEITFVSLLRVTATWQCCLVSPFCFCSCVVIALELAISFSIFLHFKSAGTPATVSQDYWLENLPSLTFKKVVLTNLQRQYLKFAIQSQ